MIATEDDQRREIIAAMICEIASKKKQWEAELVAAEAEIEALWIEWEMKDARRHKQK